MSLVARCHKCSGLRPGHANKKRDIYCQCFWKEMEEWLIEQQIQRDLRFTLEMQRKVA